MIITLVILFEIIVSALIFMYQGVKTFNTWRSLREEVFLHLTVFFVGLGIIILFFSYYMTPRLFALQINTSLIVIVLGIVYDLFYLELSILYLSIFSNSRTAVESYAPFIIGASTVINIYSEISNPFNGISLFSIFFHVLVIAVGITLIILGIRHLKKSRKYIKNQNEQEFNDYLIKVTSILPVVLISDGIGFLLYEIYASILQSINESVFLFIFTFLLVFSILMLIVSKKFASKAKGINLANFLNTIS